jgi:uridine kinase
MALFIGICGGSGAGKTYIANALKNVYGSRLSILSFDCYCCDHSGIPFEERAKVNYDSPNAYDGSLLTKHIEMLKNGKSIEVPVYDFKTHTRASKTTHFEPNEIIIVEGIMVYQVKKILPFLDIKLFVDARSDRRLARRIKRDLVERGRSLESVLTQYFATVRPMHDLYIEPTKSIVDCIYDNDVDSGLNKDDFNKILKLIDTKLSK